MFEPTPSPKESDELRCDSPRLRGSVVHSEAVPGSVAESLGRTEAATHTGHTLKKSYRPVSEAVIGVS